jgi:hypothetical protein
MYFSASCAFTSMLPPCVLCCTCPCFSDQNLCFGFYCIFPLPVHSNPVQFYVRYALLYTCCHICTAHPIVPYAALVLADRLMYRYNILLYLAHQQYTPIYTLPSQIMCFASYCTCVSFMFTSTLSVPRSASPTCQILCFIFSCTSMCITLDLSVQESCCTAARSSTRTSQTRILCGRQRTSSTTTSSLPSLFALQPPSYQLPIRQGLTSLNVRFEVFSLTSRHWNRFSATTPTGSYSTLLLPWTFFSASLLNSQHFLILSSYPILLFCACLLTQQLPNELWHLQLRCTGTRLHFRYMN